MSLSFKVHDFHIRLHWGYQFTHWPGKKLITLSLKVNSVCLVQWPDPSEKWVICNMFYFIFTYTQINRTKMTNFPYFCDCGLVFFFVAAFVLFPIQYIVQSIEAWVLTRGVHTLLFKVFYLLQKHFWLTSLTHFQASEKSVCLGNHVYPKRYVDSVDTLNVWWGKGLSDQCYSLESCRMQPWHFL